MRFDFFEPIIMLFNPNETTIKRFLELKTSLVKSWDFITQVGFNFAIAKLILPL